MACLWGFKWLHAIAWAFVGLGLLPVLWSGALSHCILANASGCAQGKTHPLDTRRADVAGRK